MRTTQQKKEAILNVATELFSTQPYHKVAMDEIARRARVAKGTLYYHFKSKEALYASLLHQGLDSMLQRLKARFDKTDPVENLAFFVRELAHFFHEKRTFFLVLQQEESSLFSKKLKNCYEKICTLRDLLGSIIKEGIGKGYIREDVEPDVLIEIIMGMIKEPVLKGKTDPELHSDMVIKILAEGISKKTFSNEN